MHFLEYWAEAPSRFPESRLLANPFSTYHINYEIIDCLSRSHLTMEVVLDDFSLPWPSFDQGKVPLSMQVPSWFHHLPRSWITNDCFLTYQKAILFYNWICIYPLWGKRSSFLVVWVETWICFRWQSVVVQGLAKLAKDSLRECRNTKVIFPLEIFGVSCIITTQIGLQGSISTNVSKS